MVRHRIHATELARLLDAATQPLYVLDEDLTIVFLNQACAEWLGEDAENLPGRRCRYCSGPEMAGPDLLAAGLCPPPAISEGREITATVCRGAPGGGAYRRARFVPLGTPGAELIGIVALVDSHDLAGPEAEGQLGQREMAPAELHQMIRQLREQVSPRYSLDRLVGASPAMRRARAQAELAIGSAASVLLVGPPGIGRQHLAATIHYGPRPESAGMLIPLACSVLEPDLLESTVAALSAEDTAGAGAGRGTLLLGDVDLLPLEIQATLASVLSAPALRLRLMATATQRLDELARRGRYLEDLAVLLSTITIELPALSQRREDLPWLAQLLLEEANARGTKQIAGFGALALDQLDAYPWPGNVDELVQVVYESHQRAAGPEITPADLPERIHLSAEVAARPRRKEETIVLDEFLGRIERELIRRSLARAKGNKSKAARLLGLTRPRLYRRMVQLGLIEETGGEREA